MENKKIELLTWNEYFYSVNEEGKMHSDNAYSNHYLDDLNQTKDINNFNEIEKRFISHGLHFEIRLEKIDLWSFDYHKIGDDNLPVKDSNNQLILLTQSEKEDKINPRYQCEHAIVNSKTNEIVARTQDDWNCLLITVAREYSGLNLGEKLLEHHRTLYPFRYSGGHTPQGKEALYRVYQNKVSKFLANSHYKDAIQSGEIDFQKLKKILFSASIGKEFIAQKIENEKKYSFKDESFRERIKRNKEKSTRINLNMSDPEDLLLHVDNNFAILYNKKSFNNIASVNCNDYFTEKGILGYVYVGGSYNNSVPKLFRVFGQNENIKQFMTEVAFNQFIDSPIRVFSNDLHLLNDNIKSNSLEGFKKDGMTEYTLLNKTMDNIELLSKIEQQYRRKNDPYQQKWYALHEQASKMADDLYSSKEETKEISSIFWNKDTPSFR